MQIEIPIDIGSRKEMEAICKYYNCELMPKKRGEAYYIIKSNDATNFFWMGANMNNSTLNSLYEEIRKLKINHEKNNISIILS